MNYAMKFPMLIFEEPGAASNALITLKVKDADMKLLIFVLLNGAVFGMAASYFGMWVCLPLAAAYLIGLFQAMLT